LIRIDLITQKALVCVGTTQVADTKTVEVAEGANTVAITVPRTPYGSAYASVTFVRHPAEQAALPRRLFGLAHLTVHQSGRQLEVTLETLPTSRPRQKVPVNIALQTDGLPVGGQVQLLAVDEGILALTAYRTPDPFTHFFGPRRCEFSFADMYDHLFPELPAAPPTVDEIVQALSPGVEEGDLEVRLAALGNLIEELRSPAFSQACLFASNSASIPSFRAPPSSRR